MFQVAYDAIVPAGHKGIRMTTNINTNTNTNTIRCTRSWGSHGVSVYGEYWERWSGCSSEEMTFDKFAKESEEFKTLLETDWREMSRGEQRPIFHLQREVEIPLRF